LVQAFLNEANAIADSSDDDKKIKQADSRAVKPIKERSKPILDRIPFNKSQKPHQILSLPNLTVAVQYSSRPFVGSMHGEDRVSGTFVSHARNMGTERSTAPTQIPSTPGWRKGGQYQDISTPTDSKDKYSLYSALPE
jgi:hypothetical protein